MQTLSFTLSEVEGRGGIPENSIRFTPAYLSMIRWITVP